FQVFIIGMKVSKVRPRFANDLWDGFALRTHRFYIQNDFEIRRIELPGESNRIRRRVDKIRFYGRKRLERDSYSALLPLPNRRTKRPLRPIPGLLWRYFLYHVSLFW